MSAQEASRTFQTVIGDLRMLVASGHPVLQIGLAPAQMPAADVATWIVIVLLVVVLLLLVVLALFLAGYRRWLDRDSQHKLTVEEQLERLAEILERLTRDRSELGKPVRPAPTDEAHEGSAAFRSGDPP
jgi:membrane protein implicated in regulation of membrane protease activity